MARSPFLGRRAFGQSPGLRGKAGASHGAEFLGATIWLFNIAMENGPFIWVNYNELTTSSLEIIVSKGNHPQMALIQVSELL